MGSVALGLGEIGSAYQQAKAQKQKEDFERARLGIEQGRFGIEKERFDIAKQQANRPSYKGFSMIGGKMVALVQDPDGKLRVQSFDTLPQDSFSAATMKAIDGIKDPTLKQAAQDEAGMYLTQGDTKGAFNAVKSRIDKAQSDETAETRRKETEAATSARQQQSEKFSREQQQMEFHEREKLKSTTGGLPESTVKALASKWAKDGVKPPAKYQAAVEEYMEDQAHPMSPKVKLSAQEQRISDVIKQIDPKVAQLEKIITDNKLQEQGGVGSAIGQHYQFGKYKLGMKPDQVHSDLIKAAAALQVMGAAPWMQIGRGKYMFETITQHLPNPSDSPALLYDKAQFLKGIIDEAKQSLPDYKGTGIGAATDPAVHQYLQSIGVQ